MATVIDKNSVGIVKTEYLTINEKIIFEFDKTIDSIIVAYEIYKIK